MRETDRPELLSPLYKTEVEIGNLDLVFSFIIAFTEVKNYRRMQFEHDSNYKETNSQEHEGTRVLLDRHINKLVRLACPPGTAGW